MKVKISETGVAHVRIYKPLPHTGQPAQVSAVNTEVTEDDDIEFF